MAKTRTAGDVVDSSSKTLNDANKVRYTDPEQLGFVADGLNMVKNMRPDLFFGQYKTSIGTQTRASVLPLDDQFFRPVVDYVIARCETKDAEHVVAGRAALMAAFAEGFLK